MPQEEESNGTFSRVVFRPEALQYYMQNREEVVFFRFLSPRKIVYFWILLAVIVASGLVAWFIEMPVYLSGSAVVVDSNGVAGIEEYTQEGIVLIAFLPPEQRLQVGQTLWLNVDVDGEEMRLSEEIVALLPEIYSPDDTRKRFQLENNHALIINQPTMVAIARFNISSLDSHASTYNGSVYSVNIEIDSRRVVSLLPLLRGLTQG